MNGGTTEPVLAVPMVRETALEVLRMLQDAERSMLVSGYRPTARARGAMECVRLIAGVSQSTTLPAIPVTFTSTSEAAVQMNVTPVHVRRLAKAGSLRFRMVSGKMQVAEVDVANWCDRRTSTNVAEPDSKGAA